MAHKSICQQSFRIWLIKKLFKLLVVMFLLDYSPSHDKSRLIVKEIIKLEGSGLFIPKSGKNVNMQATTNHRRNKLTQWHLP